jgi:hypothetical protein
VGSTHAPLQFTCAPGHDTEHAPALQTCPLAQLAPPLPTPPTPHPADAPQWIGSVVGSTHTPLQFTCEPGHDTEHAPALHTCPLAQLEPPLPTPPTPHPAVAPQWIGSVVGSTHTPLQFTCDPGHDTEQAPALHTCPLAQLEPPLPTPATPHPAVAPQWIGSVVGSTHTPLQFTCEPGHVTEHVPELQTCPLAQLAPPLPTPPTPHPAVAPQCARSLSASTHTPLQFTCEPGHDTEQLPALQTCPLAQPAPPLPAPPTPHPAVAPQCARSAVGSTHTPAQFTCEPGHDTEHAPALHTCPLAQLAPPLPTPPTPQPAVAPQCARSAVGSTHVPPQFTCEPGHDTEHAPALHTCPLAQLAPPLPTPETPQPVVAPQCARSAVGSTHAPPQFTCEPGHDTEQAPELQTSPVAHVAPAFAPLQSLLAPQNFRSLAGSTQTPPQFSCAPGHDTAHVPALHTSPVAHDAPADPASAPHPAVAPQWCASVAGSTHEPPQATCVDGHDTEQVPAAHTSPAPHARPHAPQLAPSLWRFAQKAAPASGAQRVRLPPQVVPQEPPEQAVPLWHFAPQAPQLSLLLAVSTHAVPHGCRPVGHCGAPSPPPSPMGSCPLRQQVIDAGAQW